MSLMDIIMVLVKSVRVDVMIWFGMLGRIVVILVMIVLVSWDMIVIGC